MIWPVMEWAPGSPRILVVDSWLANAGDGAISLATDRRLRSLAPNAAIMHAADQSPLVADRYPELRLLPPLAELIGVLPPPVDSGWTGEQGRSIVSQADAVLSQGGGFLMERYRPVARLHSYAALREMGIPMAFCAQSISDFRNLDERRILAHAFGEAAAISTRDHISAENVKGLMSSPGSVAVTADETFSLFRSPPRPTAGRGLGLVLTAHARDWAGQVLSGRDDLIEALSEMVRMALRVSHPEPVVIFSTVQGLGQYGLEDDGDVIREVFNTLPATLAARVRLVDGYLSPDRCCQIIGGLKGLVSMRMHPVIFGLSLGVPSLLLLDDFKCQAQFPELGLGEHLGSPTMADNALEAAIARVFDPGALRGPELWKRLGEARRRCDDNNAVVAQLLAAVGASQRPAASKGPAPSSTNRQSRV